MHTSFRLNSIHTALHMALGEQQQLGKHSGVVRGWAGHWPWAPQEGGQKPLRIKNLRGAWRPILHNIVSVGVNK
jgi:hypothetical protein